MIGTDFKPIVLTSSRRCSECGKRLRCGETMLASIRNGRTRKLVCSENCRESFDLKFWEQIQGSRYSRIPKRASGLRGTR